MCVCVCKYIYIYAHVQTREHEPEGQRPDRRWNQDPYHHPWRRRGPSCTSASAVTSRTPPMLGLGFRVSDLGFRFASGVTCRTRPMYIGLRVSGLGLHLGWHAALGLYTYMYMCVCVWINVYMSMCIHVCTHTHTHSHTHTWASTAGESERDVETSACNNTFATQ